MFCRILAAIPVRFTSDLPDAFFGIALYTHISPSGRNSYNLHFLTDLCSARAELTLYLPHLPDNRCGLNSLLNTMKTSIAVISFSPIHSDSELFDKSGHSPHYVVHSIGYGFPPCDAISHLQIASHHNLLDKALGVVLLFFDVLTGFILDGFIRARILAYILENDIKAVILNDVTSWPLRVFCRPGSLFLMPMSIALRSFQINYFGGSF